MYSKPKKPAFIYEPRPFISQSKVSFESPSSIIYERKFDTAIRESQLTEHYARMLKCEPNKDDTLISRCKNYPEKYIGPDRSSTTVARLMADRFTKSQLSERLQLHDNNQPRRVSRMIQMVEKNITFQSEYLNQTNILPSLQLSRQKMKKMFKSRDADNTFITSLIDCADWLLGVINMSNLMYSDYFRNLSCEDYIEELSTSNHCAYKGADIEISWSHQLCIIKINQFVALLPKCYILLLHNKICDLLSILIYTRYASHSTLPPNSETTVMDFCYELWMLHIEYGQDFFGIAKCLEGLASAETLIDVEKWDNSEFLHRIIRDIYEATGFDYKGSTIRDMLKKADIPFRHELAALSKISGHPFVDMVEGAHKIHKHTNETYDLDYDKIYECMCYIKQNYIRNHILRENKWPPTEPIPKEAPEALRMACLRNLDPEGATITSKYGKIDVRHYGMVTLAKNMKYHKLENAIPYLKDKTISVLRSKVIKQYIEQEDVKSSWKDTRLLLFYLMNTNEATNHMQFIQDYSDADDITDFLDYLVIRIVPKEKELKVAFRGFGCTTFMNRMLFLSQEKTAMHYLDLYSDEQAMTLSELDLVKRLFSFRNLKKAYPRHRIIYIMVDADKWNNHFRPETVDEIMVHTLDKIHGTSIFGKTQRKYGHTLFYVPDNETTIYWEGQSGGIEGLNQDTWVITYIAQIKTALSGLDLKYHILCKGDDLRIALVVPDHDPRNEDIKATKESIMKKLSDAAVGLGHKIKIYDSYGSERYFNFSKTASVDNIELPQVFRKIQKCYGASNAFLPTLDEFIGSTFSNAHSACRVTTNQVPCYIVALFWSFYYLTSDRLAPKSKNRTLSLASESGKKRTFTFESCTDDELVAISLTPSLVGGFPIIYLHNMMVRSESDLLPPFIDMISYGTHHGFRPITELMKKFLKFPKEIKTTWKPLYMDPYCLPVAKPPTSTQILRSHMIPALKRKTKAEDIRELLEAAEDDSISDCYIQAMDGSTICHAKVFSVLYSTFPESVLREFILKFESSRSVLELLLIRSTHYATNRILRSVVRGDFRNIQWKLRKLKDESEIEEYDYSKHITTCPAESAQIIRNVAWGKEIDGITMPPMSHLLGFTTPHISNLSDHARSNHFNFTIQFPELFLTKQPNFHYAVGKYAPFIGHVTGTGTDNPQLHLIEKDVVLNKLRNVAELVSWTDIQETTPAGEIRISNLRPLVEGIMKMYTDQTLESMVPFLGHRKSGTIAHHIRLRHFREAVIPNSLSNIYQLCSGESNTHSLFFNNQDHYWINFLQCYCHAISMITYELNFSPTFSTPKTVWSVTTSCNYCMRVVHEPAVVIDLSKIKGAKFPELLVTKLSAHAQHVLGESLKASKKRKLNLIGHGLDLTKEVATLGIFQLLCDSSVSQQRRLVDRYTQHAPTREGYQVLRNFVPSTGSRIIGQRELCNMDDETLTICVIYTVVSLTTEHFTTLSVGNLETALKSFPAYTLPWHTLLYELYRVGRLGLLIENIAKLAMSQIIGIQYTPDHTAALVGALCHQALPYIDTPLPLIFLSNYEPADIITVINHNILKSIWVRFMLDKIHMYREISEGKLERVCAYVLLLSNAYYPIPETKEDGYEPVMDGTVIEFKNFLTFDKDFIYNGVFERQDIKTRYGVFATTIANTLKIKPSELITFIFEESGIVLDEALQIFETLSSGFVWTTALACIETIRKEQNVFNKYPEHRIPTETSRVIMNSYFKEVITDGISPALRIGHVDFTQCQELGMESIGDIPVSKSRVIRSEYIHRAFGSSNNTMNHLTFIYEFFQYNRHEIMAHSQYCISALGDGIGNGTAFLAKIHKSSSFVFTTKPCNELQHVRPIVAEDDLITHNSTCAYEHNLQGLWDLKSNATIDYLVETFGHQHIIFCDAEPEPYELDFHLLYQKIVEYYFRTRLDNSVLILQVSWSNLLEFLKILTVLRQYTINVYMIQSPSERCYLSLYIIAWGSSKDVPNFNWNFTRIPSTIIGSVTKYLARRSKEFRRRLDDKPRKIFLTHAPQYVQAWTMTLPALWISYLRKELNVLVDDDFLTKLAIVQDYRSFSRINPVSRVVGDYLLLTLQSRDSQTIYRDQVYNMDYRTHRVFLARMFMVYEGWSQMFDLFFLQDRRIITEEEFRGMFYRSCCKLPLRDFDPHGTYKGIYTGKMSNESGFEFNYWEHYCKGVEVCLSYVAWLFSSIRIFSKVCPRLDPSHDY